MPWKHRLKFEPAVRQTIHRGRSDTTHNSRAAVTHSTEMSQQASSSTPKNILESINNPHRSVIRFKQSLKRIHTFACPRNTPSLHYPAALSPHFNFVCSWISWMSARLRSSNSCSRRCEHPENFIGVIHTGFSHISNKLLLYVGSL